MAASNEPLSVQCKPEMEGNDKEADHDAPPIPERQQDSSKRWWRSRSESGCQSPIRETPPGLLQHVLTVLVFWSWVLLLPRLPPWSRSLRLFHWASILLYGPLDIAPHSSATTRAKMGRTAHVLTAQGGTRRPKPSSAKKSRSPPQWTPELHAKSRRAPSLCKSIV